MMEKGEIRENQDYRDRLTNFSNEFDFGLFLYILRRSLIWVLMCLGVAMLGAFIYLRYTPFEFRSKTIIQLAEDDNANKILNVSSVAEDSRPEAKVELLRSKLLIGRSLKQLPLKVGYFARGQVLTNEHYTSSPYQVELIELTNAKWQDQPIEIVFNGPGSYELSYGDQTYINLEVGKEAVTPDFKINVAIFDWEQVQRYQEEYELYFVINSISALTSRFYDGLEVRILNNEARTLEVSFRDNNAYISRDFVRTHASEFLNFDLEKRRKSDENVLAFLNEQIDTVYTRLKESEVNLNNYKQLHKINNLEGVSEIYLNRLSEFESDIISLEIEERLLNEVEKLTIKSSEEIEIYNLIPLVAGSRYEDALSKMLDRLHELIVDREESLYSVTKDNERIKALDYQIGVQKNLILQTVSALRDQLNDRRTRVTEKMHETEGSYYSIPQKELDFARLQRLFTINEKYYTLLLEKSIEYKISKEGFVSNNQILEEPKTPIMPVSPNKNLVWLTFVLSGLIIGFLIIALKYFLHNKITSMNEIVKISHSTMSSLGVVPKFKENIPVSMLLVNQNPRSLLAESFRSIRTNLQFLDKQQGPKMAAVTSTISGEGKTFVALNLAGIIAFSGKKVVVCDLDMRKPKIHKGFGVENSEGMSTLLIGRGDIDRAIRKSKLENLDYITAGPIPPNPSELIISNRMTSLLEELKARYDFVILDTPPVGLVTDAVSLLIQADYPLYIFRADYSKKQFVQVADKLINENKIGLSVILNGVDLDRSKYSYKYSYGYGYGYGYGAGGYYDEGKGRKNRFGFFKKLFKR
jgi:tyrosine-protein kinase Etk/Wzc